MKDEEHNVPRALASIPAGAAILAVDAESNDRSAEIARARGARVIVRPWDGYVATRRFAVACVQTPWTFMLDADEALDDRLGAAIAAAEPSSDVDGFAVRRSTFFCGHAMRRGTWGAEAPLRFFRTGRATLVAEPVAGGGAHVHERWTVPGVVAALDGTLLHYSYPSVGAYLAKFDRYTSLEARGVRPRSTVLARELLFFGARAMYALIVRGGWRDGWRGAFVAFASAWYPVAVAWKALRA